MTSDYCKSCVFYLGDLSCMAYDQIPQRYLKGGQHNTVQDDQRGNYIYSNNEDDLLPDTTD